MQKGMSAFHVTCNVNLYVFAASISFMHDCVFSFFLVALDFTVIII